MAVNITLTEPQQGNPVLDRGPLKELYRAPNGTTGGDNIQYPRDLGSSQKKHYVLFQIYETKTIVESLGNGIQGAAATGQKVLNDNLIKPVQQFFGVTPQQQTNLNNSSGLAGKTTTTGTSAVSNTPLKIDLTTPTQSVSSGSIALYMPDSLQFQTQAQYGEVSVVQAVSSLVKLGGKDEGDNKTTTFDKSGLLGAAGKIALNYAGYTFNPQQQLLFEGINFRRFSMSFTFTPYSSKEAESVNLIVKKFRRAAAPQYVENTLGFLFIPPSQFDIKFKNGDQENPYINKLKRCYLDNVDVNYAPNGWVAHAGDGAPVQTTISLSFIETELIDKTQIDGGY